MKRLKRFFALLCAPLLLLALSPAALAEGTEEPPFALAEEAVLSGMSRSWLQGYEPEITGDRLSLVLPVSGPEGVTAVKAELIEWERSVSPLKPQSMEASVRQESGLWALRFSLALYRDRQNGDYPCLARVSGVSADGAALTAEIPVTLRIRDGLANTETPQAALSAMEGTLKVGEEGLITGLVANPCLSRTMEDPVLVFSDPAGEVLPLGSDRVPLPDLLPGQTAELALPVTVAAAAAVKPHSLSFTLNWTSLGQEMSQEEHITLDVAQEICLEQGGVQMASSVVAGDSVAVTLPLMNMGRADILNALVSVSLPGVTEKQSVLVGTIAPGETRQAQLSLATPVAGAGDYTGTLTAEGSDASGNRTELTLPLRLRVEEPAPAPAAETAETAARPNGAIAALSLACAALAALLVLQTWRLTRKLHRLEEERL